MKATKLTLLALATSLALTACNQQAGSTNAASGVAAASGAATMPKNLDTIEKQVGYILGEQVGKEMSGNLTELKDNGFNIDLKQVQQGIQDQLEGKASPLTDEQKKQISEQFVKVMEENVKKKEEADKAKAGETLKAGEKFLAENKAKEGVKTTNSGLQYKVNKEGTGASPVLGDGVMVEYTGKLIDGTEFDSTAKHGGQPFAVPLTGNSVIKGWTEGLQLMKEGGEYTLYIPAHLAYGDKGQGKIPANSVLVFDMKIVKVEKGVVPLEPHKKPEAKLDAPPIKK